MKENRLFLFVVFLLFSLDRYRRRAIAGSIDCNKGYQIRYCYGCRRQFLNSGKDKIEAVNYLRR